MSNKKRAVWIQRHREDRMPYVTDVETAPLQLQAKECQDSLAITRS